MAKIKKSKGTKKGGCFSVGSRAQTKLFMETLKEAKFLREASKVDVSKLTRVYTI